MPISDADFLQFRERAAQVVGQLSTRIESLEGAPTRDAFAQQWEQGRAAAVDRGYSGAELQRLEQLMASRGISHHEDAIRLDPSRPTGSAKILGGIPKDELDQLLSNDTEGFLQNALTRIKGE